MSETRKLAAILVSDVVGYSRLAGADEDRILARLRTRAALELVRAHDALVRRGLGLPGGAEGIRTDGHRGA
jgi:class 3 adenylate cyclase